MTSRIADTTATAPATTSQIVRRIRSRRSSSGVAGGSAGGSPAPPQRDVARRERPGLGLARGKSAELLRGTLGREPPLERWGSRGPLRRDAQRAAFSRREVDVERFGPAYPGLHPDDRDPPRPPVTAAVLQDERERPVPPGCRGGPVDESHPEPEILGRR